MLDHAVLGIHSIGHDAAVALLSHGRLQWAVESERLTRVKHDPDPNPALDWARKSSLPQKLRLASSFPFRSRVFENAPDLQTETISPSRLSATRKVRWRGHEVECDFIAHEFAHAAVGLHYANYVNGTIILVNEGRGSFSRNSLFSYRNGAIELLEFDKLPWYATGFGWSVIAFCLGYGKSPSIAGTLMAMAGYGEYNELHSDFIKSVPTEITKSMDSDREKWINKFRDYLAGMEFKQQADFVATFQSLFNQALLHYLRKWVSQQNSPAVALSGGCALNIVANTFLRENLPSKLAVAPICGDAGQAIGAGIASNLKYNRPNLRDFSIYMNGDETDGTCTRQELENLGYTVSAVNPVEIANALVAQKVVAFIHSKSELGPRALGHRSIIASPLHEEMRERVSVELKGREWFRPLAPIMREADFDEKFGAGNRSPYMLYNFDVSAMGIPACTHADGTGRVQSFCREDNELLDDILVEYKGKSGSGVLINTSLNIKGKAICRNIADFGSDFRGESGIDVIVCGQYMGKLGR